MIRLNKKISTVLIFCICAVAAMAQQYKYKAALGNVTKTGFYQINISPDLSAHLKTDLADLRIVDEQDKWVPHIVKTYLPFFQENTFKEFPILKNEINDSGNSVLILENKGMDILPIKKTVTTIGQLVLFLKNSSVSRYASLSGSMDKIHWFSITDNILLSKSYETKENYFINSISFSAVDYRYFKLTINNQKADPFNIIKAGSYYTLMLQDISPFKENPQPTFSQKDSSDGRSYIEIKNDKAYHIDQVTLYISTPKFYERNASIYFPANDNTPGILSNTSTLELLLTSKNSNSFDIKTIKSKILYLVIDNKDNPALKISGVRTKQHINTAITYLEKDKKYFLLLDNEAAAKPDYDLEIFKDSIPPVADTLSIGPLMNMEKEKPAVQKDTKNKWWLWPAITAAILVLGLLTWRLLRDMKRTEV